MQDAHLAVQARTAVDQARTGTLTTYARQPGARPTTCVAVRGRDDGGVEVELEPGSLAVRQVLARPLASLWDLTVTG